MGNKKTKHSRTTTASNISPEEEKENKNYESFVLVWLDDNVNKTDDNHQTQKKLKEIVNYMKTFDTTEVFEDWLNLRLAMGKEEKFILIVSGRLGKVVVPKIHSLPQLIAIYLYCIDKNSNKMWADQFQKIRGVFVDPNELVKTVKSNQHELEKLEDLTSLSISIIDTSPLVTPSETSSTGINGNFLWMQLFIEVLLRMSHSKEDQMELVQLCKADEINGSQLKIIEEFEKTYPIRNALWWYTRDSCLYRMLNKALRFRDIDTLITFRTFIADLYQQLKVAQQETTEQSVIYVYRGQLMSSEELNHIKSSVGRYVSMNSFFSTTLDRELAVFYLPCSGNVLENQLHGVLFEIEVDQSVTDTKPYANISHLSSFEAEREVLFMLGSIFKIESVGNSNDTQTIIRLKLCNENDHHLKELSSYLKHNLSYGPTLVSLGNLLENMGEYEKAARCYRRQLDKPDKKNSYVTGCCYTGLGVIENTRGNYNSAIRYHIKALNINLRIPHNNENIVGNYNNLASAFKCRKNYKIALGCYNKCLKIQERMYKNESLKVAKTYVNIGIIYGEQEKYHDALKYQNYALKIQEKCLPADHFIIARTCGNIGVVHHKIKDYNKALSYYQKSLEILLKSLPDTHLCLALTYHNIGEAYQDTNQLNLALQNYLKANQVYRYSLPPEHPDLLENQQYLEKIQTKLR